MELHREKFEAWLFSQPKDRVIEAGSCDSCFLCSFVKETSKTRIYFYGWSKYRDMFNEGAKMLNPPEWAMQLIEPRWLLGQSLRHFLPRYAVTAGMMQERYLQLWPDTFVKPEPTKTEQSKNLCPQFTT